MGNKDDYAEVVIETCTGERNVLRFDETIEGYRASKTRANITANLLHLIGRARRKLDHYRDRADWCDGISEGAHITRVVVNRRNYQDNSVRQLSEQFYECDHLT